MATHIRWRDLVLPARVEADQRTLTKTFGTFSAEPFERGYGTTIGNSLRRILLSSIEGAAVTKVQIEGVTHEFGSIEGINEDIVDILLNIKGLIVQMDAEEPRDVRISVNGPGDVTGAHIECDAAVKILNSEHVICRITGSVSFNATLSIERGRGYRPASEYYASGQEQILGEIPVDAIFSPVQRVRFRTEDTRVGQRTNYDRLVMDIWTNGSISPEMALIESATLLRKHLNAFVQYDEAGDELAASGLAEEDAREDEQNRLLVASITELDLSVRSLNCLQSAGIATVGELIQKSEDDLLGIRAFGRTSLVEVEEKLTSRGLALGASVNA
ncbi:MAG: DNA-directed RNA polymerase subunit alpha [Planctomycetota bacterium]|nr:DNA-directed RNA polymerase subunit alpha [Planctomycetota bacterium]MDA1105270.1 DNA-directed RNA polymerase subunit alpha [Planctomycetota bacterium]